MFGYARAAHCNPIPRHPVPQLYRSGGNITNDNLLYQSHSKRGPLFLFGQSSSHHPVTRRQTASTAPPAPGGGGFRHGLGCFWGRIARFCGGCGGLAMAGATGIFWHRGAAEGVVGGGRPAGAACGGDRGAPAAADPGGEGHDQGRRHAGWAAAGAAGAGRPRRTLDNQTRPEAQGATGRWPPALGRDRGTSVWVQEPCRHRSRVRLSAPLRRHPRSRAWRRPARCGARSWQRRQRCVGRYPVSLGG